MKISKTQNKLLVCNHNTRFQLRILNNKQIEIICPSCKKIIKLILTTSIVNEIKK